jgi:hypothetical protein
MLLLLSVQKAHRRAGCEPFGELVRDWLKVATENLSSQQL